MLHILFSNIKNHWRLQLLVIFFLLKKKKQSNFLILYHFYFSKTLDVKLKCIQNYKTEFDQNIAQNLLIFCKDQISNLLPIGNQSWQSALTSSKSLGQRNLSCTSPRKHRGTVGVTTDNSDVSG